MPVLLKWLGDALAALRPTLRGTAYLAPVLGHAETSAGGTRLRCRPCLGQESAQRRSPRRAFSAAPLLEKPPYDNAVGRRDFYKEIEVTVHEAELSAKKRRSSYLTGSRFGEKSKFFRAEAAKLARERGIDVHRCHRRREARRRHP